MFKLPLLGGMSFGTGLAVGIGTTLLAPIVVPALQKAAKPLAKGVIKAGLTVADYSRTLYEEGRAKLEQLAAEVRADEAAAKAAETKKDDEPPTD